MEFVLLTLGLNDDDAFPTTFEVGHLSGEQRTELAKFMLALPFLEVRRARIDEALWPFVLQNISDEERKAWRTACKDYVNKGTPF
jgi:hypothetical protein